MAKDVRAGRARRPSPLPWLLWLVAMLVAGGWWSLYQTTWFTVDSVRVSGNARVATQDILARAQVPAGVPLVAVDTATIQAAVAEFPEVERVRVERGWPHTVLITVTERQPVAVARTSRGYVLVDATGTAASPVSRTLPDGLVVVDGKPGSTAMAAAVAVLAGLPEGWRVAGVVAPTQDSVSVQLRGGVTVFFGSGQDVAKKVAVAVALIANKYRTINVSAPDAPTVK